MKTKQRKRQAAFTLIEVTLALGIVAFCLVPLLGMLPIGLRNDQAAVEQTSANAILTAVATDLRSVSQTAPSSGQAVASPQFNLPIPAVNQPGTQTLLYFTGDGKWSTDKSAPNVRYLLTVTFPQNTNTGVKSATFVTLQVSWPALATVANASGKVQTFVALNRN